MVFAEQDVDDYRDMITAEADRNQKLNQFLRSRVISKSPGKVYPSLALTEEDLQQTEQLLKKCPQS